jgi:hypothetical protein
MKGMSPDSTPFPWVPQENKTSFERLSARRSMHGGAWSENCAFAKNIYRFRTIDGPDGGKYHDAGAAGGDAREIRPRIVRLSVVPAALCENKSSIDHQVALRRHFCHEPLFGNFLSDPALKTKKNKKNDKKWKRSLFNPSRHSHARTTNMSQVAIAARSRWALLGVLPKRCGGGRRSRTAPVRAASSDAEQPVLCHKLADSTLISLSGEGVRDERIPAAPGVYAIYNDDEAGAAHVECSAADPRSLKAPGFKPLNL